MLVKNAFALIYNLAEIVERDLHRLPARTILIPTVIANQMFYTKARYFLMVTRNIQLGISLRITYLRIDVILHQTRHAPLFFWEIGIE